MIDLQPHPEGVILPIKAQPGARRSAIAGRHAGSLRVAVTQAAEKGKANQAVVEVLAEALSLRKSQIELVAGETSRQKKFLIRGLTLDELAQRIEGAIG
jgi:uncharacterized protein (TIGR00251 family)